MLPIEVEVAGTICGAGCSIFSQTVDRLPPVTADGTSASLVGRSHIAEKCVYALAVRRRGEPTPRA